MKKRFVFTFELNLVIYKIGLSNLKQNPYFAYVTNVIPFWPQALRLVVKNSLHLTELLILLSTQERFKMRKIALILIIDYEVCN